MTTAKIFMNGSSQAVRLPKEFRFDDTEVYIKKYQNVVILIPKDDPWAALIASLDQFSDDFMENREQPQQQDRESFE
ncbi:antitoxin [candidate division KSB1 bacterium]|nr:antitoxin [candidate division KSB1 bacterium]NIS24122.1 antitoxin [candidate division KSB1 bacterium]NIT71039.1 antitoxin [candidate division KSB1 bacterium]NIU24741.1 antitoxin [candidate division KSB1 bacterium]NIU90223.1 AbrB/MazE/SpoVT family DNA-binding domain-containing protein [candidate division KSB1 bacterium]